MTTTLRYVGKKSPYAGKTLWEILGNLKDFGVGRIVIRNSQLRYKEPCFMRVLEVKAQPNEVPPKIKVMRPPNDLRDKDKHRQVHVLCEMVFRGIKMDEPVLIDSQSALPDFSLVPKHLESNYKWSKTAEQVRDEKRLPAHTEIPPVLKEMLIKKGIKNPTLKTVINKSPSAFYRLAKDGEQPTKKFESGFGTPTCPNLLKGVNYHI